MCFLYRSNSCGLTNNPITLLGQSSVHVLKPCATLNFKKIFFKHIYQSITKLSNTIKLVLKFLLSKSNWSFLFTFSNFCINLILVYLDVMCTRHIIPFQHMSAQLTTINNRGTNLIVCKIENILINSKKKID
jgi:hypothetical protein